MTPDYVTFCSLIIDDIVLPDGRTYMNTLGGAGTHALIGMRVWSDRLGYAAVVGDDFAAEHRRMLAEMGVDLRGLVVRQNYRTARAWQLFDESERRTEVFRTDMDTFRDLKAQYHEFPPDYLHAKGYHIHDGSYSDLADMARCLRAANPSVRIVWEPTLDHLDGPREELRSVLPHVDLFCPDLEEAARLTGESRLDALISGLHDLGAGIVGIRMGASGSLVSMPTGDVYQVPAVPTTIVDVTGAGDAYCGGFLVGLSEGDDVARAAARAATSASFALEQFGVPRITTETTVEAERRLAWTLERIQVTPAAAL